MDAANDTGARGCDASAAAGRTRRARAATGASRPPIPAAGTAARPSSALLG